MKTRSSTRARLEGARCRAFLGVRLAAIASFLICLTQPWIGGSQSGAASWALCPAEDCGWMITPRGNLTIDRTMRSTIVAIPIARTSAMMSVREMYRHHLL